MHKAIAVIVAIACFSQAAARPVRRTLNFNMFVLQPKQQSPDDRLLLTTNGISRFGPLLEYLVQRVQGMMSVRLPQDPIELPAVLQSGEIPVVDAAENEVDHESRMPGIVVRPSQTKPGTYEVEINVVVDDGQPEDKNRKNS